MASSTDICNLALSHLGMGKEIGNLATEKSQEAAACRRFFIPTQKMVLQAFPWPIATKTAPLALVSSSLSELWRYRYRYPADCLAPLEIPSDTLIDTRESRIPFEVGQDETGLVIYTNQAEAKFKYIKFEDRLDRYTPDLIMAFSLLLASHIAPRVTGGDPNKLGALSLQKYMVYISASKALAANSSVEQIEVDSEFVRARL